MLETQPGVEQENNFYTNPVVPKMSLQGPPFLYGDIINPPPPDSPYISSDANFICNITPLFTLAIQYLWTPPPLNIVQKLIYCS